MRIPKLTLPSAMMIMGSRALGSLRLTKVLRSRSPKMSRTLLGMARKLFSPSRVLRTWSRILPRGLQDMVMNESTPVDREVIDASDKDPRTGDLLLPFSALVLSIPLSSVRPWRSLFVSFILYFIGSYMAFELF